MAFGVVIREKSGKKHPTRYYSNRQEKQVARSIGGQQVKNSGATMFQKGDVEISSLFLLECKTKTSVSDSISIKRGWLEKNAQEALFMGKPYNALAFNFGPNEKNYYIIDEHLMKYLVDKLKSDTV